MKNITSLTKEIYIEIALCTVFMSYNNKSYFCGNLYFEVIYASRHQVLVDKNNCYIVLKKFGLILLYFLSIKAY